MSALDALVAEPLTAERFAPFGDVIEVREGLPRRPINDATALRFDGLCELGGPDARFAVSVVRAQARALPMKVRLLERHGRASQVFLPWSQGAYLVVVAPAGETPALERLRCFAATGQRGVHYRRGTWHHPLIALDAMDFLVIDQPEPGGRADCDVVPLDGPMIGP